MTDALVPSTAIEQWHPTVHRLPPGWVVQGIDVSIDRTAWSGVERLTARVQLERRAEYFEQRVAVILSPHSRDFDGPLYALLEAVAAFGWQTDVYADMSGYRW